MSAELEPGNCARTAATLGIALELEARDRRRPVDVRIVHGAPIATAPAPFAGRRYFHAWVEMRPAGQRWIVIDYSNGLEVRMPRARYYAVGQLEPGGMIHRYTVRQARRLMDEHGHFGPWADELWSDALGPEVSA